MATSELLKTLVEMNGSDLHITTNTPPQMRVHGHLQRLPASRSGAGREQAAGLQRAHRLAEETLRGNVGARLLLRHQGDRVAVPLQRLQPARRRGRRLPADPREDPQLPGARAAAGAGDAVGAAARPGARHRPDRQRQVDHARRDARQDQRRAARPHPHRSKIRSSTSTSTRAASSTSARCTATRTASATRCARRFARIPTSCSSAKCATSKRSRPR